MRNTGDEYFDSSEFQEMLDAYEQTVSAGGTVFLDAEELASIADYYQYTGQRDEAEEAITLAMSLSPGAIAPLTYRIHEALYEGDTERAWQMFDQIIETDAPDYVYDRAEIMLAEGRTEEADEYLREQFKTVPPEEYQDYVMDVAQLFLDYGQYEKAMEWMMRAKQEDTPEYKELVARSLFGLGKYKESERLFNELVDTDPFSKDYWNGLASAQYMGEDFSGAVQSSEYAIAIDPKDPDGLIAKANSLERLDNYEEALKYYERYSEQVPDDAFGWLYQGVCLINMSRYEQALERLKSGIETTFDDSPLLAELYQEMAFSYNELGRHDEALDCMNRTDTLECDHTQMTVVKGHVLLSGGHIEEAEAHFKKAMEQSTSPKHTMLRITVSLYDNGFLEPAYLLLKKLFGTTDEPFEEGYAYMALCCYDLKRDDEFLFYLKKACACNPVECKQVLSHLFPEHVAPEAYYKYVTENKKE